MWCVVDGTLMTWQQNRSYTGYRCPNCNGVAFTDVEPGHEPPPEPEPVETCPAKCFYLLIERQCELTPHESNIHLVTVDGTTVQWSSDE